MSKTFFDKTNCLVCKCALKRTNNVKYMKQKDVFAKRAKQ